MALSDATTITELIREGRNNNFNNNNYCLWTQIGESILTVGGNILDKYIDFLQGNDVQMKVTLTSDEYIIYKYRPKELCKKLYNTEELAPIILKLNNISHEIDFIKKKIYILNPTYASIVLNKIISINEESISINHAEF